MKGLISRIALATVALTFGLGACNQRSDFPECNNTFPACNNSGELLIGLYSTDNDKQLGAQVAAEIAGKPADYPILDRSRYLSAYQLVEGLRDKILNGGKVKNKTAFTWEIKIINQNVLNAFCTPGGHIYVYTGLIKYLDSEDDLAGVMGHEMAHADLRHSMKQLLNESTNQTLISILLGGSGTATDLANLANQVVGLSYSRCYEEQADALSVDYLSSTNYNCKGTASFFAKLLAAGQAGQTPVFLSTHPSEQSRVDNVNSRAECVKCNTTPVANSTYAAVKASLP